MTTFNEVAVRCAVCGDVSRVAELTSTSSFGPSDLDLRPYGPARWALEFGVQRCRSCGYCSPTLGTAPPGAAEVVESVVYQGVRSGSRLPRLARDYFCAALVAEGAATPDPECSARRFLEAAWACDDTGAAAQARICRQRAAEMLQLAIATGDLEPPEEVAWAVVADTERRAGRFDKALQACDQAEQALADTGDESSSVTAAVVAYIRELVDAEDDACHGAAEAFARGE